MKKAIMLTTTLFLIAATVSFGAYDKQAFLQDITDEIYDGIQSGELSKREVKTLQKSIRNYEYKVWQLNDFGRISRSEKRVLQRLERDLIQNLETFMYNQETARRSRYPTVRRGTYNNRGYGNNQYGNRRNDRARNQGNGTYCPPPRRRGTW